VVPRSQLTRQELYELVWAQPMTKVAAGLGISDVALKKICVKHHVPVPGRGYWAKVAAGKTVKQAALASSSDPALQEIRIYGSPELQLPPNVRQAKREAIAGEKIPERKITVNLAAAPIHATVALTLKTLRKRRPDNQRLVSTWEPECFRVSVAPANVDRAAAILDALARAAEGRGYATEAAKDGAGLRINGELIGFRLREKVDRQPHQRTADEIARAERAAKSRRGADEFLRPWEPEWDYVPSGRLILELGEQYNTGLRRIWADGKRQRIEDLLNDFFAGAVAYAAAEKSKREERERWHREWEEQQRLRWEEEERRRREESRWKFLSGNLEALERAERIERFVDSMRAQLANADASAQLVRLLDWSQNHAAGLRRQCLPENLDAALSVVGLFASENDGPDE
jgi:hypothetical protein